MDVFLGILTVTIVITVWILSAKNGILKSSGLSTDSYWEDSYSSRRGYGTSNYVPLSQRQTSRKIALQKAQLFIKPYNKLMGEHCLTNEFVKVNLIIEKNKERKIICINKIAKNGKRKMFTASINPEFKQYYLQPLDYVVDYLWDSICMSFDYSTVYENLSSAAATAMLMVNESEINAATPQRVMSNVKKENLLNINKATEAELLALPGVNIVMAKKALKYIEKNNGFKSVDEFIQKMKIKDTFVEQIKAVTYVAASGTNEIQQKQENKTSEKTTQQLSNRIDIVEQTNNDEPPSPDTGSERIIDL